MFKEFLFEDNTFHDGVIQNLNIDFVSKVTKVVMMQTGTESVDKVTELEFFGVEWQNFENFSSFNLIWGIEYSEEFSDFVECRGEYVKRVKNFLPKGLLEGIELNEGLKYYILISSFGLDGFVICKGLRINEQREKFS